MAERKQLAGASLRDYASSRPVTLVTIGTIRIFEVQEMEIDRLDALMGDENKAIGFGTFAAGVFVTAALGWIGLPQPTAVQTGLYSTAIYISLAMAAWNAISYRRAARERPKLLKQIKERVLPPL